MGLLLVDKPFGYPLFFGRSLDDFVLSPERAIVTCFCDTDNHVLFRLCILVSLLFILHSFDVEKHGARLEIFECGLHREVGHFGVAVVVAVVDVYVEGYRDIDFALQLAAT